MTPMPRAWISRMVAKSPSTSRRDRAAVGSSRIRMRAFLESAMAISSSCRCETGRLETGARGSTASPTRASASRAWAWTCFQRMSPRWCTNLASERFSATLRCGTRWKLW